MLDMLLIIIACILCIIIGCLIKDIRASNKQEECEFTRKQKIAAAHQLCAQKGYSMNDPYYFVKLNWAFGEVTEYLKIANSVAWVKDQTKLISKESNK